MSQDSLFRWSKGFSTAWRQARHILAVIVVLGLLVSGLLPSISQAAERELVPERQSSQAELSADPGTAFGVELTPLDDSGGLQQIIATQTGWARGVVIDWADVEPAQGNIVWGELSVAAGQLDNAFDAGLEPIVVVRGVPQWARLVPNQRCGPIDPDHYDEFGSFIAQVITDYPISPNPFAAVQYWSIWNEPDIDPDDLIAPSTSHIGCWGDADDVFYGGEAYGNMLNIIYPLVKGANDQALLIAGELLLDCDPTNPNVPCDPEPASFLEGILQVSDSFDGISFHAYDYYLGAPGRYENLNWDATWDTTGPVLVPKAQFILNKLAEHQVTGKFVMNTEFALLWDGDSDQALEETKAFYIGQAYASAIGIGLKANIWYDVTGTWERNNGLLERDTLDPLPAYEAYQFTSAKFHGAIPAVPDNRFGDDVKFYAFDGAECTNPRNIECSVWVLWSLDGQGTQVTLPADPEQVQNVFGDVIPGITQTLTVPVGPYFIEVDGESPMIHTIEIDPNPAKTNQAISVSANIDDSLAGGIPVAWAEYSLNGGASWASMEAVDGAFDEIAEQVRAATTAPGEPGIYSVCVRGTDINGNLGAPACTDLPVSYYIVNLSMVNRNLYHGGLPSNGGFESGLDHWVSNTTYLPVSLATENPVNPVDQTSDQAIPIGVASALLGDPSLPCGNALPFGQDVFVGVEQQVTLPEGSISLEFKYVIYTQDIGYSEETDTYFDTFEVYVNGELQFSDSNNVNDLQCKWHRVPSAENIRPEDPTGWATGSIDLSTFAGQTVTIAFRSYSRYDGWFNTYVFLDDVMIVAGD